MRRPSLAMLALALSLGCKDPASGPGVDPAMVASAAFESTAGGELPEGITLGAPEGSVARGALPFAYSDGAAEAERAGRERQNPIPPGASSLARGEKVYRALCAVCHGESGAGDGSVSPPLPRPPPLETGRALGLPDGHLFHVIARGQGQMAPLAPQASAEDRWKVILHLRRLQSRPSDR